MKKFPLSKAFQWLEPGPVVLLTTVWKGRVNVMTMSWHMMMEFTPALIGCVISPADHSFGILRKTKECVIAIPTVDIVTKVVDIGNCSGEDVDKFEKFELTARRGEKVAAPLIEECAANLECRVVDTRMVNKYSMFVLEVVEAWGDAGEKKRGLIHANGDGTFAIDGKTMDLRERMVKWKDII